MSSRERRIDSQPPPPARPARPCCCCCCCLFVPLVGYWVLGLVGWLVGWSVGWRGWLVGLFVVVHVCLVFPLYKSTYGRLQQSPAEFRPSNQSHSQLTWLYL